MSHDPDMMREIIGHLVEGIEAAWAKCPRRMTPEEFGNAFAHMLCAGLRQTDPTIQDTATLLKWTGARLQGKREAAEAATLDALETTTP